MPRYFFHVHGADFVDKDPVGFEYPNLDAARDEAREFVNDLLHDAAAEGVELKERVELTDDDGRVLLRIGPEELPA
jgi:hypothetical protein